MRKQVDRGKVGVFFTQIKYPPSGFGRYFLTQLYLLNASCIGRTSTPSMGTSST